MTRKDYKMIAYSFHWAITHSTPEDARVIQNMARTMAQDIARTYPNFDQNRFMNMVLPQEGRD